MSTLRNTIILGACYTSSTTTAFTPPTSQTYNPTIPLSSTALYRNSPGFIGFSGDDNPNRGGGGGQVGLGGSPNSRRSMDDPFAPSPRMQNGPPTRGSPRGTWEEPPSIDLDGQVVDRQSNLSRRTPSVNEDPRGFDMDRRFSQRPRSNIVGEDPSMQPRRSWWDTPENNGRIQGGSRHTYSAPYDRDASHTFIESDGRPIDVEMEVWDGPNNTPTSVKFYSEDGRQRPMNILSENPQMGRGNTMSIRNTGPMEFPINAGVSSVGSSRPMMPPSGIRGGLAGSEGSYLAEHELNGFTRPSSPSMKRGETVQGGALRTFPLDYSVEAVQVTITTDGLPMNAKVELWGTSSHIKQLAEIYNDDGQRRPFASIIDVPGGSNTIAVYNTGPMEYPIKVVVEPVARVDGWDGREDQSFGGHLAPWYL